MKRLLLSGLLLLPLALSRTGARAGEEDAYGSLVGLAGAAASDRGPDAGAVPPDGFAGEERSAEAPAPEALAPDAGGPAPAAAAPKAKPAAPASRRGAPKGDDAPFVAVPPAAAPRVWTKVFSSLMPSMSSVRAFDVARSTADAGARLPTAASAAGSAQGLLELVAAATAPGFPASPAR